MTDILSPAQVNALFDQAFPWATIENRVTQTAQGRIVMVWPYHPTQARPGGTLSGPTQMALVDSAMYALIFAHLGNEAMAVTSHLSIDFLRKPKAADLIAEAKLLKMGKRLIVGQVILTSAGEFDPVAIAQVTYARPDKVSDKPKERSA
jgi:uncharacterized protein (TIGR00369 family)